VGGRLLKKKDTKPNLKMMSIVPDRLLKEK
jgi:hypothetical protein